MGGPVADSVPTEKSIEQKFLREATKRGWLCLKQNVIGRRGYPDRLVIRPDGLHVWVEFKRPGGRLSENQKACIELLEEHGCFVTVSFSAEDALNFVEGIKI